jgi:hypothetical protein
MGLRIQGVKGSSKTRKKMQKIIERGNEEGKILESWNPRPLEP